MSEIAQRQKRHRIFIRLLLVLFISATLFLAITCEKKEDPAYSITLPEGWSYVSSDKYDHPLIKEVHDHQELVIEKVFVANPYGVPTLPYAIFAWMDLPRASESELFELRNKMKEMIPSLLGHPDAKSYIVKEESWDNEQKLLKLDGMRVYKNGSKVNVYYRFYFTRRGMYSFRGMAHSSELEFNELLKETMMSVTFGRNVRY